MNSIQSFVIIVLVGFLISLNYQSLGQGAYSYTIDMQTIAIIVSIALSTASIIHAIRQNGKNQQI